MKKFFALAAALTLLSCSGGHPAFAYQVYPGCTAPGAAAATAKTWYVDPVNGKTPAAGGNGSATAPWNSLPGVLGGLWSASQTVPGYTRPLLSNIPFNHPTSPGEAGLNPGEAGRVDAADNTGNPPVHPGDTILLMSGNYGDVGIGAYDTEIVNSDWITLKAAPGQVPVFDTLSLSLTNKWIFDGIKVQSFWGTNNNHNALVTVGDGSLALPTKDIIFANMTISSIDNAAAWAKADWIANARMGMNMEGSAGPLDANGKATNGQPYLSCISVTASHILNTRAGASLGANEMLFSGNELDHFSDDGIDQGANNETISFNYLHDNVDNGDGNHEDGIQGVISRLPAGATYSTFSNVVIDSNRIERQTYAGNPFPTYMQAIDAFDSDWEHVTVTNNVVVTASCYGIQWASMHDSLVANNTVLDDGLMATPGCTATIDIGGSTHEGTLSSNVRVVNNLAEHFLLDTRDNATVSWDHNVALDPYQPFVTFDNTKQVWNYGGAAGTDANGNISFKVSQYPNTFTAWDPATFTYTLTLSPASPARGVGAPLIPPLGLPATDITGASRYAMPDVGAYAN